MNKNDAEAIATEALAFLAADAERLRRFLDLSGLDPASIRAAAESVDFLAGVLDYICADEALLVGFAADAGLQPPLVERARLTLAGRWERDLP